MEEKDSTLTYSISDSTTVNKKNNPGISKKEVVGTASIILVVTIALVILFNLRSK